MTSKEALERLVKQANARKLSNEIVVNRWDYEKLLDLVDRDTPKMVIKETIKHHINSNDFYEVDRYKCSCCEKMVIYDRFQKISMYTKNKHCQSCGQRLDWSALNEN